MNPKLIEAVETAAEQAQALADRSDVECWSDLFLAVLREQGVVVTWAEPTETMKKAAVPVQLSLDDAVSKKCRAMKIYKAMIQASQQE